MNRYIITREAIRGQEYIISALYDEKNKMLEVIPEQEGIRSILGDIYIGRIQNLVKNLNAAFVQIAPGQNCYLPLEDCRHPVFTNKMSVKKELSQGDELLVQVTREALKTKEPAVSTNLNLTGKYAVLTTGNRRLSVSSKLRKDERAHYLELLKQFCASAKTPPDYGIIIRTNAANGSDEQILAELAALEDSLNQLLETAAHKTVYSCVHQEPAAYLKHLDDLRQDALEEIITDDRSIFEAVCGKYHITKNQLLSTGSVPVPVNAVETAGQIRIRFYEDKLLSLSALYQVKSTLTEALMERVWLKSGAYILIEHTEALTVIDVNTGKNIAKKQMQENFLKVNKEAAAEIAHQLRLRNISGMILVDFMNLTAEEANAELLSFFRLELKKDPIPAQVVDMTRLGLVEVTRKKVKKALREIMQERIKGQ